MYRLCFCSVGTGTLGARIGSQFIRDRLLRRLLLFCFVLGILTATTSKGFASIALVHNLHMFFWNYPANCRGIHGPVVISKSGRRRIPCLERKSSIVFEPSEFFSGIPQPYPTFCFGMLRVRNKPVEKTWGSHAIPGVRRAYMHAELGGPCGVR